MVKNRDRWTIETIHRDRSLTVTGRTGRVHLPADYVTDHVELAYAETSHANQGRTVDRSFLYLDGPTDARGIYVALTRGRATNEAFVVLHGEETPADVVADALTRSWADEPAIARRATARKEADWAERGTSRMLDAPTLPRAQGPLTSSSAIPRPTEPGVRPAKPGRCSATTPSSAATAVDKAEVRAGRRGRARSLRGSAAREAAPSR